MLHIIVNNYYLVGARIPPHRGPFDRVHKHRETLPDYKIRESEWLFQ